MLLYGGARIWSNGAGGQFLMRPPRQGFSRSDVGRWRELETHA